MTAAKKRHAQLVEESQEEVTQGDPVEESQEEVTQSSSYQKNVTDGGQLPYSPDHLRDVRIALRGLGLSEEAIEKEVRKAQSLVTKNSSKKAAAVSVRAERAKEEEERKIKKAEYNKALEELQAELEISLNDLVGIDSARDAALRVQAESSTGVVMFSGKIEKGDDSLLKFSLTSLSPAYRKKDAGKVSQPRARSRMSGGVYVVVYDGSCYHYFPSSSSEAAVQAIGIEKGQAPHQSAKDLLEKRLKKYLPSNYVVTVSNEKPANNNALEMNQDNFKAILEDAAKLYLSSVVRRP